MSHQASTEAQIPHCWTVRNSNDWLIQITSRAKDKMSDLKQMSKLTKLVLYQNRQDFEILKQT